MKRCCIKCLNIETDGGFCRNTIRPVEFVLKSEENPLLRQILSKIGFAS